MWPSGPGNEALGVPCSGSPLPPSGVLGLPGVKHSLIAPNIAEADGCLDDGGREWQVPAASPGEPQGQAVGSRESGPSVSGQDPDQGHREGGLPPVWKSTL